jgi:hypothetical protein
MVRIFTFTIWCCIIIIKVVSRLEGLRNAASSEIEVRGPFPNEEYGRVLDSTNKMLDSFHSMNVAIQNGPRASMGEAAILKYTMDERAQLCSRISHLFQGSLCDLIFMFKVSNVPSSRKLNEA